MWLELIEVFTGPREYQRLGLGFEYHCCNNEGRRAYEEVKWTVASERARVYAS